MTSEFRQYRRKQIAELRPYTEGESIDGITVSTADRAAGSPKAGDMIARNPKTTPINGSLAHNTSPTTSSLFDHVPMASGPLGAVATQGANIWLATLSQSAGGKATLGCHSNSRPISNSHNVQISCAIEVMATHK